MARRTTLILGGARSGKSTHAERLAAERGQHVLYIATAQAWDDDMRERIALHRAERPSSWRTLEAPVSVAVAFRTYIATEPEPGKEPDLIVLDCMTLLASNVLLSMPEKAPQSELDAALLAETDQLLAAINQSDAEWILVSNEVGLGIVPAYPLGRRYRDALGRANQRLANAADSVLFMVAGLPMVVK